MSDVNILEPVESSVHEEGEARISAMLALVGQRVRKLRGKIGVSRRVLSEESNVSQRYLAQLETGQGNISIALLMRIADALDTNIEALVREDTGHVSPVDDALLKRIAHASPGQRAQIKAVLDHGPDGSRRGRRVALIGLRGAGKSTLGELAAHKLGVGFLELNEEIETASGIAIDEVIELYGQDGYRHLEMQALRRVAETKDTLILAVAGGIVSQPDAFDYLLEHYHTVWLKATPEEHMDRVRAQGDERPMTGSADAMGELRRILQAREVLYSRASTRLVTSSSGLDDTLERLLALFEEQAFLKN